MFKTNNGFNLIWFNFWTNKIKIILLLGLSSFYLAILFLTNGAVVPELDEDIHILTMSSIFVFLTFFTFLDISLLTYKILIDNIYKKTYRFVMYGGFSKINIYFINIISILLYTLIKFILYILIILIVFIFNKDQNLFKIIFLIFNILINNLFTTMLMVFLGLIFFNFISNRKKCIITIFSIMLFITIVGVNLAITIINNDKTYFLMYLIIYNPIFGMGNFIWIAKESWQQFLNLIICIPGFICLTFLSTIFIQKIEY